MAKVDCDYDFIIVGAGLSGIGCAHYIRKNFPGKSLKIIESRGALGGTWDLFRYPGVRSDSDMYTFSYSFNPYASETRYMDGPSILKYLESTAKKFGIDEFIQFNSKVQEACWDSNNNRWTLQLAIDHDGNNSTCSQNDTCQFLLLCSGYYDYSEGHFPAFEDIHMFRGKIIHPQAWPSEGKDSSVYKDKKVVVIGSGATAVTLVPSLAKHASHVTMVQRSPTYVMGLPSKSSLFILMTSYLFIPVHLASFLVKWLTVLTSSIEYFFCIKYPIQAKKAVLKRTKEQMGPNIDIKTHFTPSYGPWAQRFCACPDSDFMEALKNETASVYTGVISRFTTDGLLMQNGEKIEADVVIVATGLKLLLLGGIRIFVDGCPIDQSNMIAYKGMMYNKIPNMIFIMGYLNASWTLRSDFIAKYFCRLVNHMVQNNRSVFKPVYNKQKDPGAAIVSFSGAFSSGYFQRAETNDQLHSLCSTRYPWRNNQWFLADLWMLGISSVVDEEMIFH